MKVLVVTEAGDAWPSGKIRALIYKELFRKYGDSVRYMSRLVPALSRLLSGSNRLARILFLRFGIGRVLNRFNLFLARINERRVLLAAKSYDVVYLQKITSWQLVSALAKSRSPRLVYDLNDGLWLPSREELTGGRISDILSTVDGVTCDNQYGLAYARQFNKNCHLVPDPAQVDLFDRRRDTKVRDRSGITLGWIGSPATLFNLFVIWEPLERLFSKIENVTLRIVGAGENVSSLPRFEKVKFSLKPYYTQEEMVEEVLGMDIGLFPLFEVEDSLARGILKAAIYMSGEAAVVCSPIGQCIDLIHDGINGMLAKSSTEWTEKLELLITDSALRQRITNAGLETVRSTFSLERCFGSLHSALESGSLTTN